MAEAIQVRINDKRRGVFTVDNVVLNHYGKAMGTTGIALYVTLCRFANNQTQECFPSLDKIAEETGMDRKTVIFTAQKLVKLRLIKQDKQPGRVTIYTLLEPLEDGAMKEKILDNYYGWLRQIALKTTSTKIHTGNIRSTVKESAKKTSTNFGTGTKIGTTTSTNFGTTPVPKSTHERTNITNELNELPPTPFAGGEVESKLLAFLKTQSSVKSPAGYLRWLKTNYGEQNLPKLLNIEFPKWVEYLDYWKAQAKAK